MLAHGRIGPNLTRVSCRSAVLHTMPGARNEQAKYERAYGGCGDNRTQLHTHGSHL